LGNAYVLIFQVKFHPGGAKEILKKAAIYSEDEEQNKFLLLDGDQRKDKTNPVKIRVDQSKSVTEIGKLIKKTTGIEIDNIGFSIDGKDGKGNALQKLNAGIRYLSYLWTNLEFFPNKGNPEDLIWDKDFANKLLSVKSIAKQSFDETPKKNFKHFTQLFMEDTSESSRTACFKLFIDNFCKVQNDDFKALRTIIDKFKAA